jgi:hypothetical protein
MQYCSSAVSATGQFKDGVQVGPTAAYCSVMHALLVTRYGPNNR